jgi:hypothetical protein
LKKAGKIVLGVIGGIIGFLVIGIVFTPIILPFPQPFQLELSDAYVAYDGEYTKKTEDGKGYANSTIILANTGIKEIKITSLQIYYESPSIGDWREIPEIIQIVPNVSPASPYILEGLSFGQEIISLFPIPAENTDNQIQYKILITTEEDRQIDSNEVLSVDPSKMHLSKDRPDINHPKTLGAVRNTKTLAPNVSDNSEIKNVTYHVSNETWAMTIAIMKQPWTWKWATRYTIANGSYTMRIIVYDFAGLSASVENISLTIENE